MSSVSTAGHHTFDVHGIRISVHHADDCITRVLAPRLRRFATATAGAADITFTYVRSRAPRLPDAAGGTRRPVYDPPVGEVLFEDATDRLLIGWEDRVCSAADLRAGSVHTQFAGGAEDCWLASHPFFTLAFLEQMKRRARFGVHAALLADADRGVVIAGGSGSGKSTLTLCLLRAGFRFGGDDLCFLGGQGAGLRLYAFPDEVDVAAPTLDFFPELDILRGRSRRPGADKWPLLPEELYAVDFVADCAPGLLVFPRIGEQPRSTFEPMTATDALLELVPNVLLTDAAASQAHLDALANLVRQSRCWHLTTGRDFADLPAHFAALLDDSPVSAR